MLWKTILLLFGYSILIIIIYNLLKNFLLKKIKISKWVILAMAIVIFIVPPIPGVNINPNIFRIVKSSLFIILFLWWIDLTTGKMEFKNYKKDVKIVPKAKPNRIKNMNNKKQK